MYLNEEQEKLLQQESQGIVQKERQCAQHHYPYYILGLYVLILHIAFAISVSTPGVACNAPMIWGNSTRLQALRSNLKRVTSIEHAREFTSFTTYSGPPNERNSAAWKGLLRGLYFNATKEEVNTEGGNAANSIQVKGGGFLAALGVHHELHCLNKFRFFLYSHQSKETWLQQDMEHWYRHLDHCVELLRLSVMCTGDLSLYTFTWPKKNDSEFLDSHSRSPRECADWGQIDAWNRDKRTSMQMGLLVPEETL